MCAMNMFTILFLLLSSLLPLTTSLGHGNFGLPSTKFLEFINSTLIFEADLSAKVKFRINSNFSLDEYERESLAWDRNKKNLGNRWKYLFDPLNEDEINLKFDPHSARTLYDHLLNGKSVDIQFFNDEKSKAYEVLGQKSFSLNMDEEYELEVVGYHVGYHQLKVHFSIDETKLEEFQTIAVIRQKTLSLTIFRFVIWPMIVFAGVAIGCVIDFREVLSILRRPIYPIIGFVAQYGFMPLIALLIIYVFRIPFKYGFGLFSLGCCPGGGGSNMWTLIFDGNVGLSATMTFVSSVASLFMMPCWMYIGSVIFREQKIHIQIPYLSMFFQLLFAVSPLIFGMIIRQYKLSFAKKMEKVIKPMLLFFILFFLSVGLWVNLPMFKTWTWTLLFTGALLPWLGYLLAGTFAFICQASRRNIITIAIEAGMQNVGMVVMFFEFSFQPPETELGLIYPFTAAFMTTKPFWIIYLVMKLVRFIRRKKLIQKHLDTGNYTLIEVTKTKDLTENLILDEDKDEFEVYSPKSCAGKLCSRSELKLLPVGEKP